MRRSSVGSAALAIAVTLLGVGCSTTNPQVPPPVEYLAYEVGPPDSLVVTVLPDPPVIENVVVRPDGMITIQLVGDVLAGGRTTAQIAADIQNRIGRFKRGAIVTVALAGAQSQLITVVGEVRGPTTFPLTRQMRMSEAIGTVGGLTMFANDDELYLIRSGTGAKTQVVVVDFDAIQSGDLRTNFQVYGGDIIYVEPTVLAKIGYAIQQVLFPITPFFGVGTAAAMRSL
jgi:polysaccharide export outer membrane protein